MKIISGTITHIRHINGMHTSHLSVGLSVGDIVGILVGDEDGSRVVGRGVWRIGARVGAEVEHIVGEFVLSKSDPAPDITAPSDSFAEGDAVGILSTLTFTVIRMVSTRAS